MRDTDVRSGDVLTALEKGPISKLMLLKYAGASGDYSLHHIDVETARAQGLKNVVAHGLLTAAFLGQLVTDWAGPESMRRLQVRYAALVYLEDVLTCKGVVKHIGLAENDRVLATLDVWAENQNGERVTYGEAEAYLVATHGHAS